MSHRDNLKIARRFNGGYASSKRFKSRRDERKVQPSLWDSAFPATEPGIEMLVITRILTNVSAQSQRDCGLQPKVARNELPWDIVPPIFPTATRLCLFAPRWAPLAATALRLLPFRSGHPR